MPTIKYKKITSGMYDIYLDNTYIGHVTRKHHNYKWAAINTKHMHVNPSHVDRETRKAAAKKLIEFYVWSKNKLPIGSSDQALESGLTDIQVTKIPMVDCQACDETNAAMCHTCSDLVETAQKDMKQEENESIGDFYIRCLRVGNSPKQNALIKSRDEENESFREFNARRNLRLSKNN